MRGKIERTERTERVCGRKSPHDFRPSACPVPFEHRGVVVNPVGEQRNNLRVDLLHAPRHVQQRNLKGEVEGAVRRAKRVYSH